MLARLGLLIVGSALAATPAAPADPAALQVACRVEGGRVLAAVDLGPALAPTLEERLGSGLTGTVRLTVGAAGGPTTIRDYQVRFDPWSETFAVTISQPGGRGQSRLLAGWPALRRLLASPDPFDLGPPTALPEPFTVELQLELDPVTPRLLELTREQLTHPAGGPTAGARSLLGTLAALLLRPPPPQVTLLRSAPLAGGALPGALP
jgi:hypothetical protein